MDGVKTVVTSQHGVMVTSEVSRNGAAKALLEAIVAMRSPSEHN